MRKKYDTNKKYLKFKFLLFALVFVATTTFAQEKITITGKVTTSTTEPLPGVAVLVKGTTDGTTTDSNGKYEISVTNNTTLVYSFIGFIKQEIVVANQSVINISLKEDTKLLDDVVVVGYGTKSREQLISSISTVDNKELVKASVPNLESALAGRMAGVFARQTSGEPGKDGANIKIRGFGAALVVVDGIVGRDYANLDPNEIESISVLKDAASAAVYGMQGANGVVLVTTKKGNIGKIKINLSTRYGFQQAHRMAQVASTDMWQTLVTEYRVNEKLISNRNAVITKKDLEKRTYDYNTNWYDELLQNAPMSQTNINITGGTKKVKYFLSGGYLNQQGIWNTNATSKNRFNLRSNIDVHVSNSIDISMGIGAVIGKLKYPGSSASNIADKLRSAPYIPVRYDALPNYYASPTQVGGGNPVALADSKASGYALTESKNYTTDFSFEYTAPFLEGLSFKGVLGYNTFDNFQKTWSKEIVYGVYAQDIDKYQLSNSATFNDKASLYQQNAYNWRLVLQGFINYKNSFGDHHVNSSIIFEQNQAKNRRFSASVEDYPSAVLDQFSGGLNTINKSVNDFLREYKSRSIIGRFSYDYQTKYFLDVNFRYDGAQYFAKKWGLFPSVAAGWLVTKENFMQASSNVLTELKLKGSYGQLGDMSSAITNYANTEQYYFESGYQYPGKTLTFGDRKLYNPTEIRKANPDFTWSKSAMINVGFDAKLWDNLLSVSAEYFVRDRTGLPAQKADDNAGTLRTVYNLNSDKTMGYDISLGHEHSVGEFNYSLNGNLSWARTKNVYVEPGDGGFKNGYSEWKWKASGNWNNVRWGYDYIGRYTTQEEIDNAPIHGKGKKIVILPGDLKYRDINGDGYINEYDQIPIGRNAYPELVFGFNFAANWKGLDFSMFWQGAARSQFTLGVFDSQAFSQGNTDVNVWSYFENRWRSSDYTNPKAEWVSGKYPAIRDYFTPNINNNPSNFWNYDGKYIRLKNIEFGYTLPTHLNERLNISSLRIYVNIYNALTFSSQKYIDPESREGGFNLANYPQVRTFNAGLNLNF